MAVPQSTAATYLMTTTLPVSVSTSTSAKCAENGGGDLWLMADEIAPIWNWLLAYSAWSATSENVTWPLPSFAMTFASAMFSSAGFLLNISAATPRICLRTFVAASRTAWPLK